MLIKSFPSLLGLPARMSHITCWWDDVFVKEMNAPESILSAKPLGNWKGSRKPQRSWNLNTWASFTFTLLSSCLPIRENSSLVVCNLGDMKVEPCCSHYLKFQIFFGLLGYNTEHLILPISSFSHRLIGWIVFNFFPFFSLIFHVFYCFISSVAFLGHCSLSILTFIKVLVTKY